MKRLFSLLIFCAWMTGAHAETAPVSLVCFSVQIQPAIVKNFGLVTTLSISSTGRPNSPNAELGLADKTVPFSHESFFVIDDPTFPEPVPFFFGLDVPDQGDNNTNGLADFFDIALGTPALKTNGQYESPFGGTEDFTATWTRAAGQATGKVVMNLPELGTFTHDYAILQDDGTLTYSRTNQSISAAVALTNIVAADDQITGPLSLTITNNTQLGYDSGTWSGSGGASLVFHSIDSLDRAGTNYIAAIGFDDGYPATSDEDYHFWFLLIHSSDTNANGVLDLVESTPSSEELPSLEIWKAADGIEITLHGRVGATHTLQGTSSIAVGTWEDLQMITLSANTQTVKLESLGAMKFFRLKQL
jgi:hypothetical protein